MNSPIVSDNSSSAFVSPEREESVTTPFLTKVSFRLNSLEKRRLIDGKLVPAAVMLLLFKKGSEYHIIFNKRSQQVEHHKGEISFPGGVYDETDEDLEDTALRETWEEMGIKREHVTVLGELDTIETLSNFRVEPFVGAFPYPYLYNPSPIEVSEVIEVPISHLLEPRNRWQEVGLWRGKPIPEHYYVFQDHVIFGATARILHQFLALIG